MGEGRGSPWQRVGDEGACLVGALSIPGLLIGLLLLFSTPVLGVVVMLFVLLAALSAATTTRRERKEAARRQEEAARRREEEHRRRTAERDRQAKQRDSRAAEKTAEHARKEAAKQRQRAESETYAKEPVTASSPLPKAWNARVGDAKTAAEELERAIARLPRTELRARFAPMVAAVRDAVATCDRLSREGAELERLLHTSPTGRRRIAKESREWHAREDLKVRVAEIARVVDRLVADLAGMALRAAALTAAQSLEDSGRAVDDLGEGRHSLEAFVRAFDELMASLDDVPAPAGGTSTSREGTTA